jgi:hypothetical protein
MVLVGAQAALATTWMVQNPPVPSGAISSNFSDVSCTTGSSCTAVGTYEASGSVFETFAEAWNGSSWTLESTPNPTISNLDGVSCVSTSDCIAVGDYSNSGKLDTLVEHWGGTSWTTESAPSPAHATSSYLIDVACTSATKCTAAGAYYKHNGDEFTFAETLNGTTWTLHTTPDPAGATMSQFNGISCTSASACTAVGYYLSPSFTLLAESWNGTTWTIQPTPLPSGGSDGYFGGVSCSSTSACFAVGDYYDGSGIHTLSEFWNGTSWTPQTTPSPTKSAGLSGVSCTTFGPCTAVGFKVKSGQTQTMAEHWNGHSWTVQTTAIPSGSQVSSLASVSCRSKIYCTAVGYYGDTSGEDFILAEQAS